MRPRAPRRSTCDCCRTNLLLSATAGGGGSGSGSSDDEAVQGEAKAVAMAKVEAFKGRQNITVQEVDL